MMAAKIERYTQKPRIAAVPADAKKRNSGENQKKRRLEVNRTGHPCAGQPLT
jgi:hypothetical protein